MEDYYEILGVDENASIPEIKKAYYELVKKYHPDNVGSNEYDELLKKITVAYDCLSNSEKRKQYDYDRENYEDSYSDFDDSMYERWQKDFEEFEQFCQNEQFRNESVNDKKSKKSKIYESSWGNFIWFVFSLIIINFFGWDGILIKIYSLLCIIGIGVFLISRIMRLLKYKSVRIIALLLVLFIGYSYWKGRDSGNSDNSYSVTDVEYMVVEKEKKSNTNENVKKESSIEKQAIELAKNYAVEPYDNCSIYDVIEYSWQGGTWSVDNNSERKLVQYYLDSNNYINFYLDEGSFSIATYVLEGKTLNGEEKEKALNDLYALYSINMQSVYELDFMDYAGKDINILLDKSPNLFIDDSYNMFADEFVRDASYNIVAMKDSSGCITAITIGELREVIEISYGYELVKDYLPSYAGVRVGMKYDEINVAKNFNDNYYYVGEENQSNETKYVYYKKLDDSDSVSFLLNQANVIVAILWSNIAG